MAGCMSKVLFQMRPADFLSTRTPAITWAKVFRQDEHLIIDVVRFPRWALERYQLISAVRFPFANNVRRQFN
jgi:hypothetical protein